MGEQAIPSLIPKLSELWEYQKDIEKSLRVYYSPAAPDYGLRFIGRSSAYVATLLRDRLSESDRRSTFVTLTAIEASFRLDFDARCKKRMKSALSRHFRAVRKKRKRVNLDKDILEGWKDYGAVSPSLIGDLRGAFRFRNWFAHGRYWEPTSHKYDFDSIYLLATAITESFSFVG